MLHLLVVVHNVLVHKRHALGVGTFTSSSGSCGRRAAGHVGQFAKEEGKIQMIQQREMIEMMEQVRNRCKMQREAWDYMGLGLRGWTVQ